MRRAALPVLFAVAALAYAARPGLVRHAFAAGPAQSEGASKSAEFGTVFKTDKQNQEAHDAKDLEGAKKLIGKEGVFKGTVAKVFTPKSNSVVILNFAKDYKTAVSAVVKKEDFSKFPDLQTLEKKEVLVSGKVVDYN